MVEVAIATTILALALVPMLGVFLATSEEARANKNRTVAAALAASVLERYRTLPPATLVNMGFVQDWKTIKDQVETYRKSGGETASTSVPPQIDSDLILSPWSAKGTSGLGSSTQNKQPDYEKEFADYISHLKFRRFCAYDPASNEVDRSQRHAGVLTCAVVWFEKTGGTTRPVDYKLSTFVVDPIFPFGSDKEL